MILQGNEKERLLDIEYQTLLYKMIGRLYRYLILQDERIHG